MPHDIKSPSVLGRIATLWRYPVKSMCGESVASVAIEKRGVVGDRFYALRDAKGRLGSAKSAKGFFQVEGLLAFAASTKDGEVVVRFPDGRAMHAEDPAIDRALSSACGVEVTLARETTVSHRDAAPVQVLSEAALGWLRARLPGIARGTILSHHDSAPLHLLSEAALGWLRARLPGIAIDARRFRPNLVIASETPDGLIENAWLGRRLAIGEEVVIRTTQPTCRCVMVTQMQAELGAAPAILRTINGESASYFGIYAEVLRPGTVRRGDALRFA